MFGGTIFILISRARLEAIPDPGWACRNRHYCRYQTWSKDRGHSARCHYRPEPNECSSALDNRLRRDRSGTGGSRRGLSRRREEVGSSYSPSLNIDWLASEKAASLKAAA